MSIAEKFSTELNEKEFARGSNLWNQEVNKFLDRCSESRQDWSGRSGHCGQGRGLGGTCQDCYGYLRAEAASEWADWVCEQERKEALRSVNINRYIIETWKQAYLERLEKSPSLFMQFVGTRQEKMYRRL